MRSTSVVRYLWREWIRPLALPFLLITSAKSALADINYVPSGSMEPTILPGDVVLINTLSYDLRVPFTFLRLTRWADPARGDIVVCFAPDDGTRLVKRVVGLPGDILELRDNVVHVNGQPLHYRSAPDEMADRLEPGERSAAVLACEQLGTHSHAVMSIRGIPARRNFGPLRIPAGAYL